jgi:hypothetical protein
MRFSSADASARRAMSRLTVAWYVCCASPASAATRSGSSAKRRSSSMTMRSTTGAGICFAAHVPLWLARRQR